MDKSHAKGMSNGQRAIAEIRDLIFCGELAAGSDHLETELAVRLDMSRTPIREAALALEAQGLLEMRPRKGVRILALSPDDMREVYDVLTALESLAALNAAKAGYGAAELRSLEQAIDDMDLALTQDDLNAWVRADDNFHSELVRLGGNSRIVSIVAMMADQVRRARAMTLHMRATPHQSNADHRDVLDAIKKGQPDRAHDLHHAHRTEAKSVLLKLLDKHQLRRI